MKDRRVVALRVSIARCERREQTWRRELDRCRRARDEQEQACRISELRLQEATTAVQRCTADLDAMTDGHAAFSLEGFNQARRYLEVVLEAQSACNAELERQQATLREHEAALAKVRQDLARNHARAGFFERRMQAVLRMLDDQAADAADDEAQETALSRAFRERSSAA